MLAKNNRVSVIVVEGTQINFRAKSIHCIFNLHEKWKVYTNGNSVDMNFTAGNSRQLTLEALRGKRDTAKLIVSIRAHHSAAWVQGQKLENVTAVVQNIYFEKTKINADKENQRDIFFFGL